MQPAVTKKAAVQSKGLVACLAGMGGTCVRDTHHCTNYKTNVYCYNLIRCFLVVGLNVMYMLHHN